MASLSTQIDTIDAQQASIHHTTGITQHTSDTHHTSKGVLEGVSRHIQDPHPYPSVVTEVCRTPEEWSPQTVYLTVIDPAAPGHEANLTRLIVELHDRQQDKYVLVDLKTNNESFHFTVQAIRQHFTKRYSIVKSWPIETDEPF